MEKRKVFKISIIDKEISRTEFDRNTFYTSDSELTLVFKLIEKDYSYDHGEILLYNEDDESFVTREVTKKENDFVYELDLDIIPHFGKWQAQLQLVNDGDVYTSKPFEFVIVNDLSNLAPQPTLTDINNWSTLKQSANELIDEMQDIIIDVKKVELEHVNNENYRQQAELERGSKENIRKNSEFKRENQENKRQKAESERVDNEKKRRIAEFERVEKENTRQNAEQQRIEAEILRVERDTKRETEITKMQNDVLHYGAVKLVNIIKNGDFSKGLEGWRAINSDLQLSTFNELSLTTISNPKSSYPKANYIIDSEIKTGHVYYSGFYLHDFELSTTGTVFMQTGKGNYSNKIVSNTRLNKAPETYLSSVQIINSDFKSISISGDGVIPNSSEFLTFSKVYLIDLTKSFGKGNEPTKEVMDWIISENNYFEELTLRRDDIQQYEINQLRNAVIALGGTI